MPWPQHDGHSSWSPILVVTNALCTYVVFPAMDFGYLAEEKSGATSIDGVAGIWSVTGVIVAAASTSGISGLTGSASGGLTITLQTFGAELATMATDQGIPMDLMHRVTAMASIGFDSLPHNGAIITLLLVCGLSHRESYKDIFVVTVLVPLAGLLA